MSVLFIEDLLFVRIEGDNSRMLTFDSIVSFDEDGVVSLLREVGLKSFIEAIMKEYPDYYSLRGRDLKDLPTSEKKEVKAILKEEI
jgi:hypothetical protein